MLGMKTTVKGAASLAKEFRKIAKETKKQERRTMQKALVLVKNQAKRNLTGGNPLHVRTNTLRRSVISAITERGRRHMEGTVGTNVVYGPAHEYGSEKANLPARPWLEPAFESNLSAINKLFNRDMSGLLKRRGLA